MFGIAYAMGQSGAAGQGAQGGFSAFIPLILMFVIFYFLLIRPQQKKQKEHQNMIKNLRKGDRILTNGGIQGLITSVDEQFLTLEIADKVRVKVNKGYVGALISSGSRPAEEKTDEKKAKKS